MRTSVAVTSLTHAFDVAAHAAAAAGDEGAHVSLDLRPDRVLLTVQSPDTGSVTTRDIDLARRLSEVIGDGGQRTDTGVGDPHSRSVQTLEIAIDAVDIPSIRRFWTAVLGYVDEPGRTGDADPLIDPFGQGPAIWFQQMDASRPQRNRIHFRCLGSPRRGSPRISATLAARGVLLSTDRAPAFWILAEAEGNEACVTTGQGPRLLSRLPEGYRRGWRLRNSRTPIGS